MVDPQDGSRLGKQIAARDTCILPWFVLYSEGERCLYLQLFLVGYNSV